MWRGYKKQLSSIISNDEVLYKNDAHHAMMILNIVSITIPVLLIMSFINYSDEHRWLGLSLLFSALLLAPCLYLLPDKRITLSEMLFMAAATIIFSSLLIDGGIENTGLFWVPLFAFVAFAVTGIRYGGRWTGGFLLLLIVLLYLKTQEFLYLPYSLQQLVFFCCAFIFFSFVAFILEVRRLHNLAGLEAVRDDLMTANNELFQEIGEHKQVNKLLHTMTHAVTHAGGSIMTTDKHGIIEYVNPAFTRLTGYAAHEAVGQTPGILKSGYQDETYYERMWASILAGNVWHEKVIDRKKDGGLFTAMLTIAPILNAREEVTGFVGTHADITDLENMEKQFRQAQKMEAVGTLVAGIAHDFNNMLAGMTGNLYLAKMKTQQSPDAVGHLNNIEQLSNRAADMIKQLLTFARKDIVSMEQLPMNCFIRQTDTLLCAGVPENVRLRQRICADVLHIRGDATQLHQLLINLVGNAVDAMDERDEPCITIRLEPFQTDDAFLKTHSYFMAGAYARLSVEDNGCGIPDSVMGRLFEPFFTTKAVGKGTGLGLAMVYGAIKSHHGYIEVESIEGEGSAFHMYIPLLSPDEVAVTAIKNEVTDAIEGNGQVILLVDDDKNVRETTTEVLEFLGYKVVQAGDGLEALEVFKAHQHNIALTILDVIMPHLGGIGLAERIRDISPDVPVIFVTGYDENLVRGHGDQIENSEVLSKPVQYDKLTHAMQQML